jgi:hypothetical protein
MVHRWNADDVGEDKPFRGYLQLNREPGFRSFSDTILLAVVVSVAMLVLLRPLALRSPLSDIADETHTWISDPGFSTIGTWLAIGGLGSMVTVLVRTLRQIARARGNYARIKRWFKKAEATYYRIVSAIRS